MIKRRKNYTPEEKVAILKKHFVEKVTVSDICDRYNLQLTVFYRWQKQFFENRAQTAGITIEQELSMQTVPLFQ